MLAIIPARAGSKGLRHKNIFPFANHPLIAWTIDAAQQAELFDRIVVSTDGAGIADVARRYGAQVIVRPDELATDSASPKDAVAHVCKELSRGGYHADEIVLLQPTSPLRTSHDVKACVHLVTASDFDCSASFTVAEPHPERAFIVDPVDGAKPANPDASIWVPRQARRSQYHLNGAVYVVRTKQFLARPDNHFLFGRIGVHLMPACRAIDIDNEIDLKIAEVLLDERQPPEPVSRHNRS